MNVPIILCTADVWELQKRADDLERMAGVHVRTKPFNVEEMIELVQRLMAEAHPASSKPSASLAAETAD